VSVGAATSSGVPAAPACRLPTRRFRRRTGSPSKIPARKNTRDELRTTIFIGEVNSVLECRRESLAPTTRIPRECP